MDQLNDKVRYQCFVCHPTVRDVSRHYNYDDELSDSVRAESMNDKVVVNVDERIDTWF